MVNIQKSGGSPLKAITSGFLEVYTEDGETADSFIERERYFCGKANIPMYML